MYGKEYCILQQNVRIEANRLKKNGSTKVSTERMSIINKAHLHKNNIAGRKTGLSKECLKSKDSILENEKKMIDGITDNSSTAKDEKRRYRKIRNIILQPE